MDAIGNILGINRTQDASICVMRDSRVTCAIQKERLTRKKHAWGKVNDFRDSYVPRLNELKDPFELIVECYSSDPEIARFDNYQRELSDTLDSSIGAQRVTVSHHLAHAFSAFYPSTFERAAVMIIDCEGSRVRDITERWPAHKVPGDWAEVSSFYQFDRKGYDCLTKQLWDVDWEKPVGLGTFYYLLTQTLFRGPGDEGKVMGLAPYGRADVTSLPPLEVRDHEVFIPDAWLGIFRRPERFAYFRNGIGNFQECADLAAAGQRCFEDALFRVASWFHDATQAENLCFVGGTALNCVANGRLARESGFQRIYVPPAPHDGGTSLGCAVYGLVEILGIPCGFRWDHDFLGPEPATGEFPRLVAQAGDLQLHEPADLAGELVDLLQSGRVIGLFDGRSEFGPRALGHRSIIADPRRAGVRGWINRELKGREWFRPLAPVVTLESANRYFEIDNASPFMQYTVPVRPEYRAILPAVTHLDGTARVQTTVEDDPSLLPSLLHVFSDMSGVPVLLNTSFNGVDDPIVETLTEALAVFRSTPLHVMVVPPFVVRKANEPPIAIE